MMNIIFCGSKGKTGSIVFNYLKELNYNIVSEVNVNEKNLIEVIKPNSIVIDFTNKEVCYNHAITCLENDCHFICGTTGLSKEQIAFLTSRAQNKQLYFEFNPNFSLGINKLIPLLSNLKEYYTDIKIIESHHISKKDLPSGTALLLKEHLKENTPIDSIRTTYQSLDHTIILKNEYEEITIKHSVKNKLAYAMGVENSLKTLLANQKYD